MYHIVHYGFKKRRNKDCLKKGTRIPGIYCVSRAVHAHLALLDLLADKSSENVTLKASAILSGALDIKFYLRRPCPYSEVLWVLEKLGKENFALSLTLIDSIIFNPKSYETLKSGGL